MVYMSSFPVRRLPSHLWMVSFAGCLPLAPSSCWFLPCSFCRCSGGVSVDLPASQPQGLLLCCAPLPAHTAGLRLHACPLPSKQPGRGGPLPTVDVLFFLWLPHWLHAAVPLPPPRAAFCWRFLGSCTLGSARRRGAALLLPVYLPSPRVFSESVLYTLLLVFLKNEVLKKILLF